MFANAVATAVQTTLGRARSMELVTLENPSVFNLPDGTIQPSMLPMAPFNYTTKVNSILDVFWELPATFDLHEVEVILRDRRYEDLPECLRPGAVFDFTFRMQLFIRVNENGTYFVLKHLAFPYRIPVEIALSVVRGSAYAQTMLHANRKLSFKTFQLMLEMLGGLCLVWYQVLPQPGVEDADDRLVDAGYDFIEKNFPRDGEEFDHCRWISKHIRRSEGPLASWSRAEVEKAARALLSHGCLAKTRTEHPLTYMSLNSVFRQYVMNRILPSCSSSYFSLARMRTHTTDVLKTFVLVDLPPQVTSSPRQGSACHWRGQRPASRPPLCAPRWSSRRIHARDVVTLCASPGPSWYWRSACT